MQTKLQSLNTNTNWTIYFRLHTLPTRLMNDLHLSTMTKLLIDQHNRNVINLKIALKNDYRMNKLDIEQERE